MDTTRTADIDNHTRLLVLDTEVGRRRSYQAEGSRVMHSEHGLPLLIGHLVIT